jgi:hypothetical protein
LIEVLSAISADQKKLFHLKGCFTTSCYSFPTKTNVGFIMIKLDTGLKAVLATAVVASAVSVSAYTSSSSIRLEAEVPLVCSVALSGGSTTFDSNGRALLGQTQEFCNNAAGYVLLASATGDVDGAFIWVDGQRFALSANREFPIATVSSAARLGRSIQFDAGITNGGGQLSLRIVAQ